MKRQMTAKAPRGKGSPAAKPSRSAHTPVHRILALQQTIGNLAVQRLIHNPQIQAKLKISQPGDQHEQEADRTAEAVMRAPLNAETVPPALSIGRAVNGSARQTEEDSLLMEGASHSPLRRQPQEEEESAVQMKPVNGAGVIQRQAQLEKGEWNQQRQEEEAVQTKGQARQTTTLTAPIESQSDYPPRGGGESLTESALAFFEPRFRRDFSQVRVHNTKEAADSAQELDARAYTVGRDIVFGADEYAPETDRGKLLLAHELTHVIQQTTPDSVSPPAIMRGAKGKIVGWIVKVGERKLIKRVAIYSENELTKLLAKGYNVLVKQGSAQAKRIAKKVWGENFIHHTGHIIRKTGKQGLSHFQPARRLVGRAGEKGWHIFYSAVPILFFSEDVEAMEVYDDKYPGQSIAHYLTVTKYVGEESWLSYLDWINPLELVAIGGDIGRDLDRERTKELKAIVFNRVAADGTVQTYELDPEGQLVSVILVSPDGKQKTLSADEYFTFLGEKTEAPSPTFAAEDVTKHPLYASTFDADYRIFISKPTKGWAWYSKTLSFYLPAEYAKKLQKVGEFYVMEDLHISQVYAYVHPRHRAALKQPGILVPEHLLDQYKNGPKEEFLQKLLTSALQVVKIKGLDLWQAK